MCTARYPKLSYSVFGSGKVIVLLHGFPLDGGIWDGVLPFLSKHYKVIVPDLPGCGQSTYGTDDLSIEDIAESAHLILSNEKVERAVLAGHSMGGYAALAFAGLYPNIICGLALIHSFASPDNEEKKEQRRKTIELFRKGGKEPFIRQMVPALFAENSKNKYKDVINRITTRALLTETKSLVAFYNAMIKRPDRTCILNNNKMPVLWCIGNEDNIATTKNLMQQTSLSYVNFVNVYKNCGHMGMIEAKDALSSDLVQFMTYCFSVVEK